MARRWVGPLSRRQWEVAELVADGYRLAEIAERLGVTENTVASHARAVRLKLGVRDKVGVTRWVMEQRWIQEHRAVEAMHRRPG